VAVAVERWRTAGNADAGDGLPVLRGAECALPGGILEDRDVVSSGGDHRIRAVWARSRPTGNRFATAHHAGLGGTSASLTAV